MSNMSFHPFNRLPRELQDDIWRYAAAEGRVVETKMKKTEERNDYLVSMSTVPALLHACHNSRVISMPYYTPICAYRISHGFWVHDDANPRSIYFNFNADTIILSGNAFQFVYALRSAPLRTTLDALCTKLAIRALDFKILEDRFRDRRHLSSLKELTIMPHPFHITKKEFARKPEKQDPDRGYEDLKRKLRSKLEAWIARRKETIVPVLKKAEALFKDLEVPVMAKFLVNESLGPNKQLRLVDFDEILKIGNYFNITIALKISRLFGNLEIQCHHYGSCPEEQEQGTSEMKTVDAEDEEGFADNDEFTPSPQRNSTTAILAEFSTSLALRVTEPLQLPLSEEGSSNIISIKGRGCAPKRPEIFKKSNFGITDDAPLHRPERKEAPIFHEFGKLPSDIQNQVWSLASSFEPRVVEAKIMKRIQKNTYSFYLTPPTPVPAILHTCHDSRSIGLINYYQLPAYRISLKSARKNTFINFETDILILDGDLISFTDFIGRSRLQSDFSKQHGISILNTFCTKIAIYTGVLETAWKNGFDSKKLFHDFHALKEFFIIPSSLPKEDREGRRRDYERGVGTESKIEFD
ncbi:hypothetical protein G7Y89_g8659 [Cudoniella acicularis]|uniref:2EXR domain-containing protein n=1 Tax=Cudoniella acicularis TaxID=354080 RepID=A0A8H4RIR0_9HELO|nr:hypothetical protein G7Y89_g8659 [Cudoniella acicularis]